MSYAGVKIAIPSTLIKPFFLPLTKLKGLRALIQLLQIFELISSNKESFALISPNSQNIGFNANDTTRMGAVFKDVFHNFRGSVKSIDVAILTCFR
ncbi:MAG: hypothetical protein WKF91_02420 [Segetibacter sp.]